MPLNAVGIFCEDIRDERSGQVTLIGILPDNVNLPHPPKEVLERNPAARPVIPKIALYVRIHLATDDIIQPMKLKLILPDDTEIDIGDVDDDLIAKSKREAVEKKLPIAGIIMQAVLQGLQIGGGGLIRAVLQSADGQFTCAMLRLKTGAT